eukprot:gene32238-39807_t
MPTYLTLSRYFHTYKYQYGWAVSAVYIVCFYWTVSKQAVDVREAAVETNSRNSRKISSVDPGSIIALQSQVQLRTVSYRSIFIAIFVLNLFVVITVNALYVYISLHYKLSV